MATILFVDDQTYAMTARVDWFRSHGYVVLVAVSLPAAVETLLGNPVEAIVLDCHMPGARDIAPMLKRVRPELPLLVLASYCAVPCPLGGVADVCIAKGDTPATLLQTLQGVLALGSRGQEAA